ncbi:MAG: phosphopantothenoylcysteine decarboxylase [Planctomycetes bacterium]|nr:phosphopantothenoylcysteine decarboxylase [Planctomycetota bacterium]
MAHVVLGVSASVALHRGLDVASELKKGGHDVTALMTPSATKLIAPLQFQAITGRRVFHDLFQGADDDAYDHLNPARDGDLLICAPATADLIGRLAHGLADDMVTTTAVAFSADKPRLMAPAMNWRMWANPFVQRNIATLCEAGWEIVGPAEGDLACGEQGPGRLAPIDEIVRAITSAL